MYCKRQAKNKVHHSILYDDMHNRATKYESANENNICYVAHRGYTKYAPENSIPAFEAAGREGFQAVECDIHETAKDKKGKRRFVIMHDQTLNRMCGLSGKNIYQKKLTYQKIQSKYHIKTGNNIESYTKKQLRMPSLEEENRK